MLTFNSDMASFSPLKLLKILCKSVELLNNDSGTEESKISLDSGYSVVYSCQFNPYMKLMFEDPGLNKNISRYENHHERRCFFDFLMKSN